MKKFFALLCIVIFTAAVFACGKNKPGESTPVPKPTAFASGSAASQSAAITDSAAITSATASSATVQSSATGATASQTVATSATSVSQNVGTSQTVITSCSSPSQTTASSGTTAKPAEPAKPETVYDKNGNVIYQKHIGANGKTAKEEFFEYDSLDNLTSRETVEYAYDQNGRLISMLSCDVSDEGTLIPNNETAYAYDEQGNLISEAYYVSGKSGALFLFDETEYIYTNGKLTAKTYTVYDENGKVSVW